MQDRWTITVKQKVRGQRRMRGRGGGLWWPAGLLILLIHLTSLAIKSLFLGNEMSI